MGKIIQPGQRQRTPAQELAAARIELARITALHKTLINWCGANLTEAQMVEVLAAMNAVLPDENLPLPPRDEAQRIMAGVIGLAGAPPGKKH